jgi:hypothetical protein
MAQNFHRPEVIHRCPRRDYFTLQQTTVNQKDFEPLITKGVHLVVRERLVLAASHDLHAELVKAQSSHGVIPQLDPRRDGLEGPVLRMTDYTCKLKTQNSYDIVPRARKEYQRCLASASYRSNSYSPSQCAEQNRTWTHQWPFHKLRKRMPNPNFPWHWAHLFMADPRTLDSIKKASTRLLSTTRNSE